MYGMPNWATMPGKVVCRKVEPWAISMLTNISGFFATDEEAANAPLDVNVPQVDQTKHGGRC